MRRDALTWRDWWDAELISSQALDRAKLTAISRLPFLRQARAAQRPPPGDWRTWLFMGGRGAGKTRAGAEWVRFSALWGGCQRIALIGPTLSDVREVMIEGPSGLRAIEHIAGAKPHFNLSRRRLEWPNGAIAQVYSAEDPESLRGPQFDAAWGDEIAIWPYGETTWNNLQFGLRLGAQPRCVVTTTPRPVSLVQRLLKGEASVTRSATRENKDNLAPDFLAQVEKTYAGTALARQELEGEFIEDLEGAMWRRSELEANRVWTPPHYFEDVIVAIDPPTTHHARSDACGIIAAGTAKAAGFAPECFILADATEQGLSPADWAARAVSLGGLYGASRVVVEANQGGEMLRTVLQSAGCHLPVQLVHARLAKRARAIPVAALYSQNKVSHVGVFEALEDEMCRFGAERLAHSPDRVDALVWAVSSLMLNGAGAPRIRQL